MTAKSVDRDSLVGPISCKEQHAAKGNQQRPGKLSSIWKRIRVRLDRAFLRSVPSGSLFATIYYLFFNESFRREQAAVFAGKVAHLKGGDRIDPERFTLRRNIHRLEKALIMRPRRSLFATDYIGQTISAYLVVVGEDGKDPERADELKWCTSVLALYFQTIEGNDKTNALKKQFEEAGSSRFINLEGSVPYLRSSIQRSEVSYDQLLGLFRQRRSTRWFLDEPVPRDVLDKAVLAALQSPSACNRQPFQFRIIDGPEVKQIASIPMGTSGYSGNIPVIVAVVGSLDAYFDERDRHVIYVDGALASMSFMLALETLGLASCPINWPDIEERERAMDKALDLKPWERPIMLMAVGKPDPTGGIPYSEKAPLSCMRRYQ